MPGRFLSFTVAFWIGIAGCLTTLSAAEPKSPVIEPFQPDNLVAWCIVPFDAKKRGPKARVEMLAKLGFKKYAYDWRAEHLPTFGEELDLLKQHQIELTGLWFPTAMNDEARTLLAALRDHHVKTQLWVTGGGGPTANADDQKKRVDAEVQRLRPIAEAAAEIGCTVALYNHGGWFGEPENQLAIIAALNMANVGIVYNQHHGHDHVDRFPVLLKQMMPHLLALNLNGMIPKGDQIGQKIMPLGTGSLDLPLLKVVKESGYRGPIGILGHTSDDAEERLSDNLDGLTWLLPQLGGKPAGLLPKYRTFTPPKPPGEARLVPGKFGKALEARNGGTHLEGQPAFREAPLTLELWAKLPDRGPYNILLANELKSSGTHWELFSMAGSGELTVYLPGYQPDHVSSKVNICDDQWHALAMIYEPTRVRLFVDGQAVADQKIERRTDRPSQPGGLAIGELVAREIGCGGLIDDVRLSKGVREITAAPAGPLTKDTQTIQLWNFDDEKALPKVTAKPAKEPGSHWGKDAVGFDWTEKDSVDGRWNDTNVGPFLASNLFLHQLPPVRKALSMRVGEQQEATVCFDTENLQWRAAWTGGFLKFDPARYGLIAAPKLDGNLTFAAKNQPGWSIPGSSEAARLQYKKMYQHGRRLAVEYTVDDVTIRERPDFLHVGDVGFFRRHIEIGACPAELVLHWGQLGTNPRIEQHDGQSLLVCERGEQTLAAVLLRGNHARWDTTSDGAVNLRFGAAKTPQRVEVRLGIAHAPQRAALFSALRMEPSADDPATWIQPAATLWPEEIVTQGVRGADNAAYVIDTLALPVDNPYKALLFVGGHDFFANGDIALCTAHGDVWRVSGVDDNLQRLVWKRYATGLFQPLGLKIVDDHVYVLGRDQITRLIDQNGDHAADVYECFCNQYESSPGGHDYVTCLERDSKGNWYLAHANEGVVRISPDGRHAESIATGLRNPNGLGVGGGDIITAAPQEGEWTPASAVFEIHPGDHYGYKGPKITDKRPLGYDPPLCWIPRRQDNSCGGQCWADTKNWGPLSGLMLHFSFGQCTMLPVLREVVDGVAQGATMEWPLSFDSGVMRGRFNPRDGQLYVSGLKGWVSSAVNDGCLQRVRYTGQPVLTPVAMKSYRNGIALTFSAPLSKDAVEDAARYRIQRWDYRYGAEYGSEEYRDVKKGAVGRDDVDVLSATVLDDGKTLFLEMDDFRPAMQYAITGQVADAAGHSTALAVYPTIHRTHAESIDESRLVRKAAPGTLDPAIRQRLKTGLILTMQREEQQDVRVSRLAAWQVARNEAPTLRLAPGSWTGQFTGWLQINDRGTFQFRGEGNGVKSFTLAGETIAFDSNDGWSAPITLGRGYFPIVLDVASQADTISAGRLLWQSETFAEEPLPPTALWHDPSDAHLSQSTQWRHGRALFEDHHCGRCHEPAKESHETIAPSLN
ncbi:MAG: LamG-like jellyroll fold domain-containing protein, partial [Planctomycetaceae bacterium]|nr:LamG-like jellyroll fold domain-containing protein [Planctomycetaceae bacterium]